MMTQSETVKHQKSPHLQVLADSQTDCSVSFLVLSCAPSLSSVTVMTSVGPASVSNFSDEVKSFESRDDMMDDDGGGCEECGQGGG